MNMIIIFFFFSPLWSLVLFDIGSGRGRLCLRSPVITTEVMFSPTLFVCLFVGQQDYIQRDPVKLGGDPVESFFLDHTTKLCSVTFTLEEEGSPSGLALGKYRLLEISWVRCQQWKVKWKHKVVHVNLLYPIEVIVYLCGKSKAVFSKRITANYGW